MKKAKPLFWDKPFRIEIFVTESKESKLVETEHRETMEKAKSWADYRMKCYARKFNREGVFQPWNAVEAKISEEKCVGFIDAYQNSAWTEYPKFIKQLRNAPMKICLLPYTFPIRIIIQEQPTFKKVEMEFVDQADAEIVVFVIEEDHVPAEVPPGALLLLSGDNPDKTKGQLSERGIEVEGFGGTIRCATIGRTNDGALHSSDIGDLIRSEYEMRIGPVKERDWDYRQDS